MPVLMDPKGVKLIMEHLKVVRELTASCVTTKIFHFLCLVKQKSPNFKLILQHFINLPPLTSLSLSQHSWKHKMIHMFVFFSIQLLICAKFQETCLIVGQQI